MSGPLFTVITPTFNSGEKLAVTAASVFAQEQGLYEFIVVDGASTDQTLTSLPRHDAAVRVISEPDSGVYDAMNKGVRLARGTFLYFLGAGDRLKPGVLRALADLLPTGADARCFVYGDVAWARAGGHYGGAFDTVRLAYSNISHQAIFYGREIFNLVGEYDTRYKICADYALNIRCFGQPEIRKLHLDLVIADFEGGGISENVEHAFYDDMPALARRHLGLMAGLLARYHHSRRLWWLRWLGCRLALPWHTLPGRLWRRIRSKAARSN